MNQKLKQKGIEAEIGKNVHQHFFISCCISLVKEEHAELTPQIQGFSLSE